MEKKKPAQVFHFDLYGKREDKYDFLSNNAMKTIAWQTLQPQEPELFFVAKDFEVKEEYDEGFSLNDIFNIKSSGIKTSNDAILVSFDKDKLIENVNNKFNITINENLIKKYSYKPFINKYIYYDDNLIGRSRKEFMSNFFNKENYGICIMRNLVNTDSFSSVLISKNLLDINFYGFQTYSFPLYLYPENTTQQTTLSEFETLTGLNGRTPNLNMEIVNEMAKGLGIPFVAEKTNAVGFSSPTAFKTLSDFSAPKEFSPIDILDYIYAVLHSPSYREKYKEFLKIDFPRVPYPKTLEGFETLRGLGSKLRQIHLLESEVVDKLITQYPEDGDNVVVKPIYKEGNVFINETQYFANVPEVAWNFYIGGYQPAQKWLKDRKDRELSYDDILHYQKIIVSLTETDRLMKEIDKIEI